MPSKRITVNTPLPGDPVAGLKHRLEEHLAVIYPDGDNETLAVELLQTMGLEES